MASQKISEFNVSTSLNDSDLFTFVINSTNKNISYSDLKLNLGVTGSISQTGDSLGVPVLSSPAANTYEIRNLESTKGVIASVSAQNGVTIGANFTQSTLGTKIIPDLNAAQYKLKTLQGGEGVSITDDGDVLTFSATGVATPSNSRFIASEADFDNQTATTITLTPGLFYQIGASFSTSKNIISDGATIQGLNSAAILTYTGTGSMFTTSTNTRIKSIFLNCPNATVFTVNGTDSGDINERMNVYETVVIDCVKLLESNGAGGQVFDLVQVGNMSGSSAVSFSGLTPSVILSFQRISLLGLTAGAIGFDLGNSVTQEIEFSDVIMFGDPNAIAISGLTNSGNITAGNLATVSSCNFSAFTNQLNGISVEDVRWGFLGNASLADSISDGLIHTEANALETIISTPGVSVKLNGAFLDDDISRFDSDGTGRLTYIGERPSRLPIDITATVKSASGGDKQIGLCISLNSSPITTTCVQGTASSTKLTSLTTIWQHDFVSGDYIESFVSNETDTINVIAQQCVLRIN
jgi:hypothetical protein